MSDHYRAIEALEENFPAVFSKLVQQVKTQNANLIAGAKSDAIDDAAKQQIRNAIGNLIRGSADDGIDPVDLASLQDSPDTLISQELDAMSKRVASGHSAKTKPSPKYSQR